MLRPSDYCELDRRFVQFKHEASTDDFALQSYDSHSAYFDWGSVGWADLLSKPGVAVLLGEPSSGRSYEFKARCQHLMEAGTPAFYLELHRLVDATPAQILGEQDAPRLHGWQRTSRQGVFFLDAVDEAKLERVSDFGLALENFSKALGSCRSHATVFISSRISEWSPETDLRLVAEKLSAASEEIKTASNITRKKQEKKAPEIPVYVIAPLKREQVATFAKALGVADTTGFLATLDQCHAWEFARRPADVRFLVQSWKRRGQIGSLTDMLEESLSLLLAETEEKRHRAIKFQLSPEQARLGAEALAAATLFCRTLDFEITDTAVMGRRAGLKPLDCLPPSWTDIQSKALLDRPLFDSAIYGRVRFHHRRLAEYLAACWLRRRMENQCPPPVLHDLLFVLLPGGRHVIRPSRAPVAVWLACIGEGGWVNDLRTWLLEASPHSFLRYGDPSLLPIAFRHQIIDAFVLRFKDRKDLRVEKDDAAMGRLAEPGLATSLSRHLLDQGVGVGVKTELLDFALHGRVRGCVDAALEVLRASTGDKYLEDSAIDLISAVGTPAALTELAALVQKDQEMAARHAGLLASALFPVHLDVGGLRDLLLLRQSPSKLWRLSQFFRQKPSGWCPFAVLEMLVIQVFTAEDPIPHENFAVEEWITDLILSLLQTILEGRDISTVHLGTVAKACWLVREEHLYKEQTGDLNSTSLEKSMRRFPELRRSMFWHAVINERNESASSVRHDGRFVFHDILHFCFCAEDLEWLLKDTASHADRSSRAIAAWFVFDLWRGKSVSSGILRRLLDAIRDFPELLCEVRQQTWLVKKHRMLGWWYWLNRKGAFDRWFWQRRLRSVKKTLSRWRGTWNLHTKIRHLRSGKYVGWLQALTREASRDMHWAVENWSPLLAKRGRRITNAVQEGCVAVWQSYDPSPIHSTDGTPSGVIVGLCGLQFLHQSNRLDFARLTPADASRAARYAVNEMNGYSEWIEEMALHHPDAVRTVLNECIQHEWHAEQQNGFWSRHMDFIGRKGSALAPLVSPMVAGLVAGSAPPNTSVFSAAIDLLIEHNGMERTELSTLSTQKLSSLSPESPEYLTWLLVCLQTNAAAALDHLEKRGREEAAQALSKPENNFMVSLCAYLRSDHRGEHQPQIKAPDHLRPQHAARFIRLVYMFVDPSKDIQHPTGEGYSPNLRDNAQSYRSALLNMLANQPDAESEGALRSLLSMSEFEADHDWIRHLIDERIERQADGAAFHARDIRDFELREAPPRSAADLFQTVRRRLSAIKHVVENADQSRRMSVRKGDREVILRRFIALELSDRSNHCYTAPQECVIQVEERLDIRVENPNIVGPVVIEVKLGDLPNRTVQSLLNDLEGQLVRRYLRDENSRHGIYLVGYTGERAYWQHPESSRPLSFEEVICLLQLRADEIRNSNPAVEELRVVGIDFRPPGNRRP